MSNKEASTGVRVVHAQRAKEADGYAEKRRSLSVWAPVAGIAMLANVFLVWLAFFHYPQDAFVPTTNAAAVCRVPAINEHNVDYSTVIEYAVDAAVAVNTYDHRNYQRQIETVAQKYFTTEFRNAYISAFGKSRTLESVKENYFIVSATSAGTGRMPVLSRVSDPRSAGPAWWIVDVPLIVSYSAGAKAPQPEKLLLKVKVSRVPPTRANTRGIAITAIDSSYLLN